MRLVNTYLSEHKLKKEEIKVIYNIFKKQYIEEIEVNSYKYDDRKYYETDFDVIDIEFLKGNIYKEINKLIKIHEKVIQSVNQNVEIIVANDDTDSEIQVFEKILTMYQDLDCLLLREKFKNLSPIILLIFATHI